MFKMRVYFWQTKKKQKDKKRLFRKNDKQYETNVVDNTIQIEWYQFRPQMGTNV